MENRKIVRASNRRKFLVGLLGSGAILAVGSVGWFQLAQNMRVALNTKAYPYHIWDQLVGTSYSPDLNLMAMVNVDEEESPQAKLYIWDYQQQRMTTLPTGSLLGEFAWSPDNRYLLVQGYHPDQLQLVTLDLWDIQTQRKRYTYTINDYSSFRKIHWSPDGSQIALLSNKFVILSPAQLALLFSFNPPDATDFTWSSDGQKVAFLCGDSFKSAWSIQTWDVQTQKMEAEIAFQGQSNHLQSTLSWSPDGTHIAALAHGQLQIVQVGSSLTSYALDELNDGGKIAWSPDSRYLAVAVKGENDILSPGSTFSVWDIVERTQTRVFQRNTSSSSVPDALAWSEDGKHIRVIGDLYQQENWNWPSF